MRFSLSLLLLATACASPSAAPVAPAVEPVPATSTIISASPASSVEPPWAPPSLEALRELSAARSSAHAGGRYTARILASDPGAYLHPDIPYGFEVCEQLREGGEGPPSLTLCARKGREGWRFGVLVPGSPGWRREGALEECGGCHGAGVQGGLLGPLAW